MVVGAVYSDRDRLGCIVARPQRAPDDASGPRFATAQVVKLGRYLAFDAFSVSHRCLEVERERGTEQGKVLPRCPRSGSPLLWP